MKKSKQLFLLLIMGIIIMIVYFFYQKNSRPETPLSGNITNPVQLTPTIPTTSSYPTKNITQTAINIPKNWTRYTGTDPQARLTVSLSLPLGYSFGFSGSEWNLVNSQNNEFWDYSSSILFSAWSEKCNKETDKFTDFAAYLNQCCLEKIKNYYDGGSRRTWYQKYLNGDFSCSYPASAGKIGNVISVEEIPAGNLSYLKIKVSETNNANRFDYLYVQNGILHILRPTSNLSAISLLEENLGIVFYSLQSKIEK